MTKQDALFVSHGSPMLALQDGPAHQFLKGMERKLDGATGILVASAHWETAGIEISTAAHPETIHDFSGFPRPLYEMRYPAPGARSKGGAIERLHESFTYGVLSMDVYAAH